MVIPKVQQYNSKSHNPAFTIYALCKGSNSGKPLEKPCPNCFAILCKDEQQREFYKSLLCGLWISKAFHQILVGSVIEFIRINDFKKLVAESAAFLQPKQAAFENDLKKIKSYEQLERQYLSQAAFLSDLKKAIIYRHLRR